MKYMIFNQCPYEGMSRQKTETAPASGRGSGKHRMHKYAIALVASCAIWAGTANAEVLRCKDAAGNTVYSDHACGAQGKPIGNLNVNGMDPIRIKPVEVQLSQESQIEKSAALPSANCPGDFDIRNMETSLSSTSFRGNEKRDEREFLQAEVRRARACSKEGGSYTADDWRKIRQAQAAQNNSSDADRARARAVAEEIHAMGASKQEVARMQTDRLVRAQRDVDEAFERGRPRRPWHGPTLHGGYPRQLPAQAVNPSP